MNKNQIKKQIKNLKILERILLILPDVESLSPGKKYPKLSRNFWMTSKIELSKKLEYNALMTLKNLDISRVSTLEIRSIEDFFNNYENMLQMFVNCLEEEYLKIAQGQFTLLMDIALTLYEIWIPFDQNYPVDCKLLH